MAARLEQAERFLGLHRSDPLLVPNPWDAGSAKLFAELGFDALATTSSGYGNARGASTDASARRSARALGGDRRRDRLPVTADLENGFGHEPGAVAETMTLAAQTGAAGCSVEDFGGKQHDEIYDAGLAAERVAAAAEVTPPPRPRLILTARRELPPRAARPRRHDCSAPVVRGCGRRRGVRPGRQRPRRHPPHRRGRSTSP
jgi:2-methylisocitrate lyase-like PEP mutase family enzyme